jgi:hypothetical protein
VPLLPAWCFDGPDAKLGQDCFIVRDRARRSVSSHFERGSQSKHHCGNPNLSVSLRVTQLPHCLPVTPCNRIQRWFAEFGRNLGNRFCYSRYPSNGRAQNRLCLRAEPHRALACVPGHDFFIFVARCGKRRQWVTALRSVRTTWPRTRFSDGMFFGVAHHPVPNLRRTQAGEQESPSILSRCGLFATGSGNRRLSP